MAHYSSLFTLGLLSDRASPPPSPESNIFYKFRKSSLPTRALSSSSSQISGPLRSHHAPPQFTNPFANSSHATTELRSFLSLDLAADSTLATRHSSKHLSPLDTGAHPHHPPDLPPYQRKPSSSWHFSTPTPTPPLSLPSARRPSRDSLRTLPSPRPAPSSALPEIPSGPPKDLPHLPPPIMIPHPSLFPAPSSQSAGGISPTSYHAPLSAPPAATLSPSDRSSSFALTSPPVSPLSSPSFHGSRQGSFMSFSSTGTSIRTSRRRNMERSNALACLEGRSRNPARVPRSMRQRNFMSMSDDEAEEVGDGEDTGGDADVEDDGDTSEPPPRATFRSAFASPVSPRRPDRTTRTSPVDEEEDRVLPPAAIPSRIQTPSSKPQSRSRRSTLESWFPLANFIDLKDEELQGWRGVVEIVNGL